MHGRDQERVEPEAGGNDAVVPTIAPIFTRSGRAITAPERLIEVMEPQIEEMVGTAAELRYLSLMAEVDNDEIGAQNTVMGEYAGCNVEFVLSSIDVNDAFMQSSLEVHHVASEIETLFVSNDVENFSIDPELQLVGAGVSGGFDHTDELKVMNYRQAMNSPDREAWIEEVENEYKRFEKFKVFKVVPRKELPKKFKMLTTTWAMKKKSNGKLRGRLS